MSHCIFHICKGGIIISKKCPNNCLCTVSSSSNNKIKTLLRLLKQPVHKKIVALYCQSYCLPISCLGTKLLRKLMYLKSQHVELFSCILIFF